MTDIAHSNLLGNKAYGTKEILEYIKEQGAIAVIPPKSNAKDSWTVDYCLYKESSKRSNGFAESPQDLTSLTGLFLLSFIWLLL